MFIEKTYAGKEIFGKEKTMEDKKLVHSKKKKHTRKEENFWRIRIYANIMIIQI